MSTIDVKGLTVQACHGVLESEKRTPQLFIFDISVDYDGSRAVADDDVNFAVDYAKVCSIVTDYCKNNAFNLIERLSSGAAFALAKEFESINTVTVTVHKPQAPIDLPFSDVSATERVERNRVILSLGSSEGDKKGYLDAGIKLLSDIDGVKLIKTSDYIETQPYGGVASNKFLNCAVMIDCLLTPESLLSRIHGVEDACGRVRKEKWGDRTLDIDIVFFGNKVVEREGLCIPHPDYFNRDFVLLPLKQIAGDFVCPLRHRRVSDM